MSTPNKCDWKYCLVHGFEPKFTKILVNRAFQNIVIKSFSAEDMKRIRQVANGKK